MSKIAIQCRLIASESTRQKLWKLMAELNTPLINELLQQLSKHPDFEKWRKKGKLPSTVVYQLCQPLKADPSFAGQPSRFYLSAIHVVDYIYKSWLKIQKRLQQQLDGKIRWLEMLNSDAELVEISGSSLEAIRTKATEILAMATPESDSNAPLTKRRKTKKSKKSSASDPDRSLSNKLFDTYQESEIQAIAEAKCPGYVEIQQKYAKQYRVNIHSWSYGRLIQSIQSKAAQVGIMVEEGKQPIRGSPQDKAKELALSAYHNRLAR
ncbi:MAG: type V CRISPR-associated protein Cas12k [Mojavia pulchra JT2-VF2]|jgi:IS605 OrfB family transposase|uniref:Type V CRISPR-associated protein Cas12k n=1 Tax=Mojavia pulchra JT2-VF2 TaxID=287848 RepID=A0A951PZA8_9NOST|nr:type V CRISPR-associated protein Cas12k [Mojavia pulchra JT2-VF2]